MNCPNCGAPMTLAAEHDSFRCEYCLTVHVPQPDLDGVRSLADPAGLHCPVCQHELVAAALDGHRVVHCPNCKGILFQQGLFGLLVRYLRTRTAEVPAPPRPFARAELDRRLLCPSCGRPMDTHPYAGPGNVAIDLCAPCALVWLDYSELNRILTAPGRDRDRPLKNLFDEEAEADKPPHPKRRWRWEL
ncbi:MAG TPA: zf-TFIIB domain-containing protein [Anaerolineaceae bacterium]|nr:zf-TFIIB domain-containing protein [Anaerolineaceae bacterium]